MEKRTAGILSTLLLMSILPLTCGIQLVNAQSTSGSIEIAPAVITDIHPTDVFQVDIVVDIRGAPEEMFLWQLSISWNPQILSLVGDPIEGSYLKDQIGDTVFRWREINLAAGYIESLTCGPLTDQTATGSGVIATLNFEALATGHSYLDLYSPECACTTQNESPLWHAVSGNLYAFDRVVDGSVTVGENAERTRLATGRGWMRIAPKEHVYGPAELYKMEDKQIELVITYETGNYSRTWNIVFSAEGGRGALYVGCSDEWGFFIAWLRERGARQFWVAFGKGIIAFGFIITERLIPEPLTPEHD